MSRLCKINVIPNINLLFQEQFLELAMDTDNDNMTSTQEKPKHKKHKKHKKSKKSAITLDEFLNMNQDVFGEGLDFQGVEEVPTQAVAKLKRKQPNSAKITNPRNAVMSPSNLDKLKRQGIVVKRANKGTKVVRNNPTATGKPIKISCGVSKAMINKINSSPSVKTESADSLLNKLLSKPNSQLKIVKRSENLSESKSLDQSNPNVGMKTLALPKDDITTQPDEKVDAEYSDEDNHEIVNNSKVTNTQINCDDEGDGTAMEATTDSVQTSKQNVFEMKTSSEDVEDNSEIKQNKVSAFDQSSKDKLLTNAQLTIKPIKTKLNSDFIVRTGASVKLNTVRTDDHDTVENDSNYSDNDEHVMSTRETTGSDTKNKLMHNSQLTVKSSNVQKLIPKINENFTDNKLSDEQQTDNIKEDKLSDGKSGIANRLLGNSQLTIRSSTPKPNQGIQRPIKSNEDSQMLADKDDSSDVDLINNTISKDKIFQAPQNKEKAKTTVQPNINKIIENEDITTIIDDSDSDDLENNFESNLKQNTNVDKIKLQLSKQNQSKITNSNNTVINKCNVVSKSMNVLKNIKGITVKSQCKTIQQLQTEISKEDFPNDGGGFESFSDGDNDDGTANNIATHLKVCKPNFNINNRTKTCITTVQSVKQCNINRSTFGKDTEETLIVRSNKSQTQTAFVNKLTNANSGLSIKPIKNNRDSEDIECDDSKNKIKLDRVQDVVGKLKNTNTGLSVKSLQNKSQLNECDNNDYEDATSNKSNVLNQNKNSEQAAIVSRLKNSLGLSIKGLQNKIQLETTMSGSGDNDSDNEAYYECDISQKNMDNYGKKHHPIVNKLKNTNIGVSLKPLENVSQDQQNNMSFENDSDDLDDYEAFVNSRKLIGQNLKSTAVGLAIKAKGTNKNDFDISPEREDKQLKSNANVLDNLNTYKGLHVKSSKYNIQGHCSDAEFDDDDDQRSLDDDFSSTRNQIINQESIMNKLKNSSVAISVKPSTNRNLQHTDDHESDDECIQDIVNNKLKVAEARLLKHSVKSNIIDKNFESDSDFDDNFDETEQYEKSKQDLLVNKLKNTNMGLSIKPMKSHIDSSSTPNNSNRAEAQVNFDNEFKKVSPAAPEKSLKRDGSAVFGNKSVAVKQPRLQRPTIDDMQQVANTSRSCINKSNRTQAENKTVLNTNQGEVVSKEVSLKTVQNQTVIEEVTTTVTRTIRTINQQSVNENISTTSLNRPTPGPQRIIHKPVQPMKIRAPTMQVKSSVNQNLPMRPQMLRPNTPIKPSTALIRPSQRMAQPNQPTFGKPLRISPNVLKPSSTIKQAPGNVRVQGCVKKSEETNFSAMKSVSINKSSQVVRNSSTIAKKACSSTVTSKFCASSSVQQFRTASSVNVANSGMVTQKGTPNLIQKLQQQGLLIKKPRLDIDFSDETDSNDGFPDSEDYTVINEH